MNNEAVCKNCEFWNHLDRDCGICIRHAPIPSKRPGHILGWPSTAGNDGCGEFVFSRELAEQFGVDEYEIEGKRLKFKTDYVVHFMAIYAAQSAHNMLQESGGGLASECNPPADLAIRLADLAWRDVCEAEKALQMEKQRDW